MLKDKERILSLAEKSVRAIMQKFTPQELPPAGRFHYHQSVFLMGAYDVYKITKKQEYLEYIIAYFNNIIDENGNFEYRREELDTLQVGFLLFDLFEITQDQRYVIALKKLAAMIDTLNMTTEYGFWHKDKYPYQMWLDGLFMAGPFMLRAAKFFHRPELIQQVLYQERLMRKHMFDSTTGLPYHAWDEKRQQPWANEETGCSPEFWGRSVGWYGAALHDILTELEGGEYGQHHLEQSIREYVESILAFKDSQKHVWYQIVDKGEREDNWIESSSTALYIYTIAKAISKGYISTEFESVLDDALTGMIKEFIVEEEVIAHLNGICIGTSAGVYDYYVNRPQSEDDLHGVGTYLFALMACYHLQIEE
ncbi:glycoside hydrolase family 88 protein [Aerococcaceae bacterium zg-ZUI334]|uniref:glycoside hydrolase family 88/105 protein n=1 Tax=Aerococcaceae TaxID=186827 RepID=UPI0013B8BAEC|nr:MULTISPECIES: glycoside hydrolase family 88 protein [unclassified Facklamia]MBR7927635.1 glycoside hydrolase family 88 protein [Aerococcaceae bacterium zg-ZUI334]MBS4462187.1 glycoside hydrolase family 88 protein [Aerococcaceae bacterium zg-B36]QQD65458.1 glycoside hydrolase family 88 protein [Aerococcaceae bacterium zg-252]NEW64646.1 glycoside hydrolase 105 family protein [Facklamia sp. 252]NEW67971.1 glycoside hydrolase 105 family protein [Facklamia sp. 253]